MRARVLHLGVTGAAAALVAGALLPGTAWAAPADGSRIQVANDLGLQQTISDTTPVVGTAVTYEVSVTNPGAVAVATDTTLTVVLPSTFTFVSAGFPGAWTCTTPAVGATGSVDCTIPNVPAAPTDVLEIVAQPISAGTATSTATVANAADPVPANNVSELEVTVGDAPVAPAPGAGEPVEPGFPEQPPRPPGPSGLGGWYGWDDCDWDCY